MLRKRFRDAAAKTRLVVEYEMSKQKSPSYEDKKWFTETH